MCCSAMLSIMSSLFSKQNSEHKNVSSLYSLIVTISAFLSWGVICAIDFQFDLRVIWYSLAYGLFYAMALLGLFNAFRTGPASLTAFIKQLSLIGVALWGFIFWNTPFTSTITIGLIFITAALYLCLMPDKKTKEKNISARWCFFSLLLLVGNAGCSIIQKYQQMAFDGSFGNLFMFFVTGFSAEVCAVTYFQGDRCRLRELARNTIFFPIIGGISSAVLNLLILLLISTSLSESVIFPGIAVGGLILTTLFSVTAYKEKLYLHQWFGLSIGAVALVFLNL